jgi:serine/threonine protein kinase
MTDRAPPPAHAPGATIGRYRVVRVVGEGAMGRVYEAIDPTLDRTVALKVLHPRAAASELARRLEREARAMARLSHPGVMQIFDTGTHEGQPFLAMELIEGGTLRAWLDERPRPWREVLDVFLRAGHGLAAAHDAKLVHRDFKPDNVIVGRDGRVRVTDFGLAGTDRESVDGAADLDARPLAHATLTATGALLGTPAYMAPEQMRGESVDARADLYAFGVALHEGLFGARPFEAATWSALLATKEQGALPTPSTNDDVPAAIRDALSSALRPRADDRPATMHALLSMLERGRAPARPPRATIAIASVAAIGLAVGFVAREAKRATPPSAIATSTSAPVLAACDPGACRASHADAPHVCRARDGACVPVASEDCTTMPMPAIAPSDEVVWIGSMLPTKGPNAEAFGLMNLDAVELARREITTAIATYESAHAGVHLRKLVIASCDDATDPARAARHLVEDVGVPAIVGFGSGQKLVELAGAELIPHHVLAIAALSQNPLVTQVPQPAGFPRMVWRATSGMGDIVTGGAAFVREYFEPRLPPSQRPTRVVLLHGPSAIGRWFGERTFRALRFNGATASENGERYRELDIPAVDASNDAMNDAASRIVEARPSLVLALADNAAALERLLRATESHWPKSAPRPLYLLTDNTTTSYDAFLGRDVELRRRFFAHSSVAVDPATLRFVERSNRVFARKVTAFFNGTSIYDAVYLSAFAALAVPRSMQVDGVAIARAFPMLGPPGPIVEVGANDLSPAIDALVAGGHVDLAGSSSDLDFDPATGEVPTDVALVCASLDKSGAASDDVEAGLYYRAKSARVEGTIRCP